MPPLLLCIHMDQARLMRLSMLALSHGISVREVKEAEWGQSLAALCGLEPQKGRAPAVRVSEEMLVFAFFPDFLLDTFLSDIKRNHVEPVRLKAVLTPHNRHWNCARLWAELSQEAFVLSASKKETKA